MIEDGCCTYPGCRRTASNHYGRCSRHLASSIDITRDSLNGVSPMLVLGLVILALAGVSLFGFFTNYWPF